MLRVLLLTCVAVVLAAISPYTPTDTSGAIAATGRSTPVVSSSIPSQICSSATTSTLSFSVDDEGTISGRVYRTDGTTPVSNAMIGVTSDTDRTHFQGFCSDAYGEFSVSLSYGGYKLYARGDVDCGGDPNFAYEYWPGETHWENATSLTLSSENSSITDIKFTLDDGGSFSGSVADDSGAALGGGVVTAVSLTDHQQTMYVCARGDGTYVVPGLPYGEYGLLAFGYCGIDSRYAPEWWEHVSTMDDATPLVLNPSLREHNNIDFALVLGGSLSGHVYGPDGETPISDASINIKAMGNSTGTQTEVTSAGTDGAYFFGSLRPGSYVIQANSDESDHYVTKYYQDYYTPDGATLVQISAGGDVIDIDFVLEKTKTTTITTTGGALQYTYPDGGETSIEAPAGAVTTDISLVYAPIGELAPPIGSTLAGIAFQLDARDDSGVLPDFAFDKPLTITVSYTDANVDTIDEDMLRLYFWDEDGGDWVDAATTCSPTSVYTRVPGENTLSVDICHLTPFALLEKTESTFIPVLLKP